MGQITRTNFGLVHTFVVNDAQIRALPTTPIQILPPVSESAIYAPVLLGVGWAQVTSAIAVAYGNVNAAAELIFSSDSLQAKYMSGANKLAYVLSGNRVWQLGNQQEIAGTSYGPGDPVDFQGGISLSVNNGGDGDFEDGDADNTLTVTLFYCAVPVS